MDSFAARRITAILPLGHIALAGNTITRARNRSLYCFFRGAFLLFDSLETARYTAAFGGRPEA
jgi:hypothetical protein